MTVNRNLFFLVVAIVLGAIAELIATKVVHSGNLDAWTIGSLLAFYCSFIP